MLRPRASALIAICQYYCIEFSQRKLISINDGAVN